MSTEGGFLLGGFELILKNHLQAVQACMQASYWGLGSVMFPGNIYWPNGDADANPLIDGGASGLINSSYCGTVIPTWWDSVNKDLTESATSWITLSLISSIVYLYGMSSFVLAFLAMENWEHKPGQIYVLCRKLRVPWHYIITCLHVRCHVPSIF